MFALEINFQQGVSEPETIFVRRPYALIGASDYAHVVVDDMQGMGYQLRIARELGRRFRSRVVGPEGVTAPVGLEGVFRGDAWLDTGKVRFNVSVLDFDLALREGEAPDSAGVRILRRASASPSPVFPAVAVTGSVPMVVSFAEDQPIYIGRSKQCALRIDASDISARHARLGFENGSFWIEDLGSTNGTFVNGQQISGRVSLPAGESAVLGREISIVGVTSDDELAAVTTRRSEQPAHMPAKTPAYPILISASEVARPARLPIPPGTSVSVGRDPGSDMWLGAPHVSRRHFSVALSDAGVVLVTDQSTNGTAYGEGVLKRGDVLEIPSGAQVLDLGSGVTVAICFNEEQERNFMGAHGAADTFSHRPKVRESRGTGTHEQPHQGTSSEVLWKEDFVGAAVDRNFAVWLKDFYLSRGPFGKAGIYCVFFALIALLYLIVTLLMQVLK